MASLQKLWLSALAFLLVSQFLLVDSGLAQAASATDDDDVYEDDEAEGTPVIENNEKDVVVLTKDNFKQVIKENDHVLVEFYAPWCGHCKALAPEYAEAATLLKGYEPKVVLAKVDATEEKELAEEYNVAGFPTLYFFSKGSKSEYGGGRKSNEIVAWLKKKTGPPAVTLNSKEDAEAFLEAEKVAVIGYFSSLEGPEWEAFQAVAKGQDGVAFAQTVEEAAAKAAQIAKPAPSLVLLKDEVEKFVAFEGSFHEEDLEAFVTANELPLVVTFSTDTADKIFNNDIKKVVLTFAKPDELETILPALQEASRGAKGKSIFVFVDMADAQTSGPVAEYFGVKGAATPLVAGFEADSGKKFRLEQAVSSDSVKVFAKDFLAGKLQPFYKSDPVPEHDEGDVKVVVGKTFEKIVLYPRKDVLLEVYAPWCGHCKSLEPIWNKLGKRFRSIDSVIIAKMDGTTNEHQRVMVHGFPTILFFKAGNKTEEPMVVDVEERTLKAFTEFLKQNAAIPFELKKKVAGKENVEATDKKEAAGKENVVLEQATEPQQVRKEEL